MNDLFLSLIPILCSCNGDLEILLYSRHLLSFLLSFFLKVEGFFTRQLHMCIILGYFYAPRLGVRRDKRSLWPLAESDGYEVCNTSINKVLYIVIYTGLAQYRAIMYQSK